MANYKSMPRQGTERIAHCSHSDFLQILADVEDFWGSDRTLSYHHPMFINEFGNTAFVIKANDQVIAYLFGFVSQTEQTGYVHLIGVRQGHQKKGLGKILYGHFKEYLRAIGVHN